MGRKRSSTEDLMRGREESTDETDADDAFLDDGDDGENDGIPNTQPVDDRVLKDVVAYVEVRTKTENRSKGVSKQLELLGAKVEKKFTSDVTHVVWKDGKKSTRDKAVKKGIRLVSVLWVDSCKQNQEHVAESLFPVVAHDDKDVLQIGKLKRMKSMQPKEVEEDIQRSAGRGTRKRRARVLHQSPAPLTITNPAILVAETQPLSPVPYDIPHTSSLIPDTPSSMKPCLDLLDSIKKGQGSAHRRLSTTDSPNISPSTPLCQRLFQCFTEEANSCAESPSNSVKLHKSGPVRRPNSRRKLADGEEEMDIDSPSEEVAASSRGNRGRSTATPSGRKSAKVEGVKVSTHPADMARNNRGRGQKNVASASDTKLVEEEKVFTPPLEVAQSSRGRGRKRASTSGDGKSNVSKEIKQTTEADIVALEKNCSTGEVMEENSKKKGNGRKEKSMKRKLSLDCESSSSQEKMPAELKDSNNGNDGSVLTKRKRRSSIKASKEIINIVAEQNDVSETKDVTIASTSTCGSEGTRSSQEKNATVSQENCTSIKNKSQSLRRRKKTICRKESYESLSSEKLVASDTSSVTLPSGSGNGSRQSSTRRRSGLPDSPVQPSHEDGQIDQSRRRSNRRKSAMQLVHQPSLADHLRQMGLHCSVGSIPSTSSAGRPEDITGRASLFDAVITEEEVVCISVETKQESLSSGGSHKSAFDEVREEYAKKCKMPEKENQNEDTLMALSKRIGVPDEDGGKKRKLLSPLPCQLTCSSILSSSDAQNRPSIEEFKVDGHRVKRSALKKDSVEALCTSSDESTISSEDLDDTQRKENKNASTAVNKKKSKRRKKVILSDSLPTTRKKKSTIVMTSLHSSDQEIVISVVKDLGRFAVTDTVCDTTTHVVVGENRRTLNVLSGIARGCWIVSMDWVYRSVEAGSWLTEEPYEMNVHFPGAMQVSKSSKEAVQKTFKDKAMVEKKSKYAKQKDKKDSKATKHNKNSQKEASPKTNQQKSADKKKRTKQQNAQSKGMSEKETMCLEEREAGPEKSRTRKRKSGKEQLLELRAKRRRRKSEQEGEKWEGETEAEIEKTEEKESQNDDGDTTREAANANVPMSLWDTLSIPSVVHQSLQTMGFTRPTPIQAGCIPAAINEGKDIVGAAETGSGKTLAFGIPVIYRILQHQAAMALGLTSNKGDSSEDRTHSKGNGQNQLKDDKEDDSEDDEGVEEDDRNVDVGSMMTMIEATGDNDNEDSDDDINSDVDDDADDESDYDDDDDEEEEQEDTATLKSQRKCVDVVDNITDEAWLKAGLPLTSTPAGGLDQEQKLFGLVLTPTRELAVQVKNHLVAAAKMTNIKIAVVVGGMSAEKQKRVLKKRPNIIVGTPGRLWELYQLGEPHLASLPDIQCLVIDEADRMVEKGHYAELSEILDLLNSSEARSSRQTFVFSATLSLIHLGPLRKSLKKAYKQDKKDKLDSVMAKVGIREDAEVVDLTKREGTASTLLESKIVCAVEEKDIYLFYFLRQYPGRTLVFTNSIDCIRRLVSILTLLECQPLSLHSSMHQKQRLKNLERFTRNPKGLLLATDVAARGLDIPDIEHVIHYQVPRTSESYVHRSGRTARQAKAGLSVTLVSPIEMNFYRRLCKTLNREEIPSFPVEHSYYQAIKERVDLARDIDKLEHVNAKKKHQNDWFVRAAKELDVDVDEHMNLHDMGDSSEQKQFNKKMKKMRAHLKALLKKRIFPSGSSQRYLTSHGKLLSPFSQATIGSHEAFSKMKARMKKDKEDDSKEKEKKRKKFKRMGRYRKQNK